MALRARVVVAVSAAVALIAPASADAAYRAFQSPSGRLACAFYSDAETPRFVRCEWDGGDHAVTLTETGKGKRIKITDTVRDPKARKLAYGKHHEVRQPAVHVAPTGITCRSTRSGHGFTVSVERQRVF